MGEVGTSGVISGGKWLEDNGVKSQVLGQAVIQYRGKAKQMYPSPSLSTIGFYDEGEIGSVSRVGGPCSFLTNDSLAER